MRFGDPARLRYKSGITNPPACRRSPEGTLEMSQSPILVTGAAGFIGFALAQRLLQSGHLVIGVDSLNNYYDPKLKEARLAILEKLRNFALYKIDLADRVAVENLFRGNAFHSVVHLAAQAGVRYSIENPHA